MKCLPSSTYENSFYSLFVKIILSIFLNLNIGKTLNKSLTCCSAYTILLLSFYWSKLVTHLAYSLLNYISFRLIIAPLIRIKISFMTPKKMKGKCGDCAKVNEELRKNVVFENKRKEMLCKQKNSLPDSPSLLIRSVDFSTSAKDLDVKIRGYESNLKMQSDSTRRKFW